MNTILQKRIKEAAYEESSTYDLTEIRESNAAYNAAIKIATFILQNQWISVEEALPDYEENVLVTNNVGDYWFSHRTENENVMRDENNFASVNGIFKISNWMHIPSLGGGEE